MEYGPKWNVLFTYIHYPDTYSGNTEGSVVSVYPGYEYYRFFPWFKPTTEAFPFSMKSWDIYTTTSNGTTTSAVSSTTSGVETKAIVAYSFPLSMDDWGRDVGGHDNTFFGVFYTAPGGYAGAVTDLSTTDMIVSSSVEGATGEYIWMELGATIIITTPAGNGRVESGIGRAPYTMHTEVYTLQDIGAPIADAAGPTIKLQASGTTWNSPVIKLGENYGSGISPDYPLRGSAHPGIGELIPYSEETSYSAAFWNNGSLITTSYDYLITGDTISYKTTIATNGGTGEVFRTAGISLVGQVDSSTTYMIEGNAVTLPGGQVCTISYKNTYYDDWDGSTYTITDSLVNPQGFLFITNSPTGVSSSTSNLTSVNFPFTVSAESDANIVIEPILVVVPPTTWDGTTSQFINRSFVIDTYY